MSLLNYHLGEWKYRCYSRNLVSWNNERRIHCRCIDRKYNPSGKHTVTFPQVRGQISLFYNHKNTGRPYDASTDYGRVIGIFLINLYIYVNWVTGWFTRLSTILISPTVIHIKTGLSPFFETRDGFTRNKVLNVFLLITFKFLIIY